MGDPKKTFNPLSQEEADEIGNFMLQHLGVQSMQMRLVRKAIDAGDHAEALRLIRIGEPATVFAAMHHLHGEQL